MSLFIFLLSKLSLSKNSNIQTISVYYNQQTGTFIPYYGSYDKGAAARAAFIQKFDETGWNQLQVETGVGVDDFIASRAAGYAEAYLTSYLFETHYDHVMSNLCKYIKCENGELPDKIISYITQLYQNVENSTSFGGDFRAGKLLFGQIDGLYQGYLLNSTKNISLYQFWAYLCQSNIYDYARNQNLTTDDAPEIIRRGSSFVSWSLTYDEIYFGHNSWRPYNEMQRIAKRYRFRYNDTNILGQRRAFSSYPLMPFSDDSFVISDSYKILMSTVLTSSNSVIKTIDANSGISSALPHWYRATIALLVSHSGSDFYKIFSPNRTAISGVQYMYIDLQKTDYKKDFYSNFLWVAEETNGINNSYGADLTPEMRQNGFVSSYDIPKSETVFENSGYPELAEKEPEMFSFNSSVRSQLFSLYTHYIYSLDQAEQLISRNQPNSIDFLQKNSTVWAIAGRYDLTENNPQCWGAFDAKITTLRRALHLLWHGKNGPSNDNLPSFHFDQESCTGVDYTGLPNVFNYDWAEQYFDIVF